MYACRLQGTHILQYAHVHSKYVHVGMYMQMLNTWVATRTKIQKGHKKVIMQVHWKYMYKLHNTGPLENRNAGHTHTCMHTHTHTHMHAHTHTYTHACTHTCTHTHTHNRNTYVHVLG